MEKNFKLHVLLHSIFLCAAVLTLLILHHPARSFADEEGEEIGEDIPFFWSKDEDFRWYYKTEVDTDKFRFLLNGKIPEMNQISVKKYKEFLHVHFKLQHNDNTLQIFKADEPVLNIKLFYAPSYEAEAVPEEALPHYFHSQQNEAVCAPCHRMTPNKSDIKPANPKEQICYPCHLHMFDKLKSKHKPAAQLWLCLLCHKMEEKETDESPDTPLKYTIEEGNAVAPLCYKCHKKFNKYITSQEYIHGPLGMDGCNMCHDPHGSAQKRLLQKKATTLCVDCHEMQDLFEMPVVHPVLNKEGCIACHDQHGSNHSLQLKNSINELCFSCHPNISKLKNDHPVQGHPVSAPVDPTNKQRPFTCISCHNPHAAENKNLLPEQEMMLLCARCHTTDLKK